MRYKSKKQRNKQLLTTSLSMDSFNKTETDASNNNNNNEEKAPPRCVHHGANCPHNCDNVQLELVRKLSSKYGLSSEGRSRSETRITEAGQNNGSVDDVRSMTGTLKSGLSEISLNKFATMARLRDKSSEIKQYNAKTVPKRIAYIKKQRAKTVKETSTFYFDLPIEDTVLRITESSENLSTIDKETSEGGQIKDQDETDEPDSKIENKKKHSGSCNDVEIISNLLKEHKEFDRILKKPPKKKSIDNGKICSSHEMYSPILTEPPTEQPALTQEAEKESTTVAENVDHDEPPEPIYESLLRNVHVPYKFSPILNRSMSQQHYRFNNTPAKKPEQKRPESDYVTLLYSESGELKSVDGHVIKSIKDEVSLMRNSDSNINYTKMGPQQQTNLDAGLSSISSLNLDRRGSLKLPLHDLHNDDMTTGNIMGSSNSIRSKISRKSVDQLKMHRRASDVAEMCRQIFIHKQGSQEIGSRMAHVDYADPKTLFTSSSQNNILINKQSLKPQRDSVCSLTSSNDSVNNETKNNNQPDAVPLNSAAILEDFCYEKNVEDTLENDVVFRDSAIYSDDSNEKKTTENIYEVPNEVQRTFIPVPIPPRKSVSANQKKALSSPPPLPAKPKLSIYNDSQLIVKRENQSTSSNTSDADDKQKSPNKHSSWVSKQIKNFEH